LDTPVEYLCEVAHAQTRYLGLIQEGENAWEVRDWKERVQRFVFVGPVDYSSDKIGAERKA
jgi:hypothetical protein